MDATGDFAPVSSGLTLLLQQLADPSLRDIPSNLQIAIGNAAFDVAVATHANEHLMLRQGARVIREHTPETNR
jgi:hypothetical protein